MSVSVQLDPRRAPIRVVELDLAGRTGDRLSGRPAADRARTHDWLQGRVLALVRLHRHPVGLVQADIDGRRGDAAAIDALADAARGELADAIAEHLRVYGCPDESFDGSPLPCSRWRREVLDASPMISVVIATRERPDELSRCLESIRKVDYPNYEVIVVDNDPHTDAAERLVRERFPDTVSYVREPVRGCSVARNHGVAVASGEIIAFTDDDVVVDRDWLAALAGGFASGDRVGCVTGLTAPAELETPAQVMFEAHGGFSKGYTQRRYHLGQPGLDPLFPFVAGRLGGSGNSAFSAAALRYIGGFDPAMGPGTPACGGEDLLAFFQTLVAGYSHVYQPDALVWHHHRRTDDALAAQALGYGTGLTAYLTAALVHEPQMLPALLRRVPRGTAYAFQRYRTAPRGAAPGDLAAWPRHLSALEWRGLAYGPLAYARSRWRARGYVGEADKATA